MDGQRFDSLTKVLVGARPSRRGLVRGAIGSALVGVLGGARGADAAPVSIQAGICRRRPAYCVNSDSLGFQCGESRHCRCAKDETGEAWCANTRRLINEDPAQDECDNNNDCGAGERCFRVEGCFGNRRDRACLPLCTA